MRFTKTIGISLTVALLSCADRELPGPEPDVVDSSVSDDSGASADYRVGLYLPQIRDDAFRTEQAVLLLPPSEGPFNDHCLVRDSASIWHLFAIADVEGVMSMNNSLAHASAETFPAPMTRHDNVLRANPPTICAVWAPHIIVQDDVAHMFYTDTQSCEDLLNHTYAMRLATASPSDLFDWTDQGVLFEESGYARDPFVFFDEVSERWIMYFNRKIEPGVSGGMTAVSYKTSTDLVHWSDETGDAISDVPDTQEIPGAAESPQVVFFAGYYYLFFTHPTIFEDHTETPVYRSDDPTDFGAFEDRITTLWVHAPEVIRIGDDWYITHAGDPENTSGPGDFAAPGVQAAPLDWMMVER